MKQRLALFVFLVFCPLACKSSGRQDSASTLAMIVDFNEPQTYAKLADERVHASFNRFFLALDNLTPDFSSAEVRSLETHLVEFEDMLEIFVHVLPLQDDNDPFVDLYSGLEEGRNLLNGLRTRASLSSSDDKLRLALSNWAQHMTSERVRKRYEQYLAALNRSSATRRTIPVLENYCWGRVDYIPQLKASAVQELQAFMKALLNATRIDAEEAREIDDILPVDQRQAFEATRRKSRSILAINRYFPLVFEDFDRIQKALPLLTAVSQRYENFNGLLLVYDTMKDKKSSDAKNLEKKILEEWSAIKQWPMTIEMI